MNDFQKIEYLDLRHEYRAGRLPPCVGRTDEISRITRTLSRNLAHHVSVVGRSGVGKTTLLYGATKSFIDNNNFPGLHIVMLNSPSLQSIGAMPSAALSRYQEAFLRLEDSVVMVDDFGSLLAGQPGAVHNWLVILQPLLDKKNVRLIISTTPGQWQWAEKNAEQFIGGFGMVAAEEQPAVKQMDILRQTLHKIQPRALVDDNTLKLTIDFVHRFPTLGSLPKAGIQILDDAVAEAQNSRLKTSGAKLTHPVMRHLSLQKARTEVLNLVPELITQIISEKTGIPLQSLTRNEKETLKQLPQDLNRQVVGQEECVSIIAATVQRAKLGLRGQNRPLASFLLLGPSGVGKTETAKVLARHLYGKTENFLRIDMSEFGEAHTVQRLIGAPPGYAGFDNGGQLTNHLLQSPYSLILLDEIEKANGKIFDIFLQLLDDGRLTSGQGQIVDATQSVFMATSNLCVDEIISHYETGNNIHDPAFIKQTLIPVLSKYFRMEFLNRFDGILVYNPLSINNLTDIALLEIKKIEERVKEHHIQFAITRAVLEQKIRSLADPRFGARPVKRFVEEMCENLIAEQLLN